MMFNAAPAPHSRNARIGYKGAHYRAAEAAAPPVTAASSSVIYWKIKDILMMKGVTRYETIPMVDR